MKLDAISKTASPGAANWRLPGGQPMAEFAIARGSWAVSFLLSNHPLAGFTPDPAPTPLLAPRSRAGNAARQETAR